MRLGYGLNLEQTQKLIMTPELRQAIAILQLSALELSSYIDQQLLENPLLDVLETPDNNQEKEPEIVTAEPSALESKWDLDWQEYFNDHDDFAEGNYPKNIEEKQRFEPFVSTAPTLQEHLLEQLHVQRLLVPLEIAEYIVGNLDDNGYLTISLEEIAEELNVPLNDVEAALEVVQGLDPLGVGARTLEECLLLQLPLLPECPSEMPKFLKHLEDLAAGKIQRISSALKISVHCVQALADLVRKLDPKPGRRFSSSGQIRYIVPDVVVEEIQGEFIILVNDITVPRLGINQAYRQALGQAEGTETRKFVEQKLNSAMWIIKSIEQRRLTLYKVANSIVKRQRNFLRGGIRHLKPLTLKDIAEEIGVHESTVSRATANKYVQTPRGIYDFKFFFASSVGEDQELTTEGIKQAMKDLISSEDPKNPYSDQKISDILKARDIQISRRTVAKYRDELGIPATSLRKRY